VLVKKLDKGYYGKAIGRGAAGFPGLKSAEPDREPALAQQLGGLGLADIVLCAPGFEAEHDRLKLFSHRSDLRSRYLIFLLGRTQGRICMRPSLSVDGFGECLLVDGS
jgi:hypothetical protein